MAHDADVTMRLDSDRAAAERLGQPAGRRAAGPRRGSVNGQLLAGVSANELRARLLAGELSCAEVVEALLSAIGDDELRAWAAVDPELLRARAAALDRIDVAARERLPLFGVPVAIKDVFDTADLPTAYGSPIYAGHRPDCDAAAVAQLRQAGAVIAGKAACAEFAWMTPPPTRNPLDRTRTPGGSSNGSAAAVAAGVVPLATGTQTAGSINRPASYCGVLGYKPTFGRFDRSGVKLMSPRLDTVGLFARDVEDLRLAGAALEGSSAAAPGTIARRPRLAWAPTPLWDRVEPEARAAIDACLDEERRRRMALTQIELPGYAQLAEAQETIQRYESARSLARELESDPDGLSPALRKALMAGAELPASAREDAVRATRELGPPLVHRLAEFDAVLTPSATGVPPIGLDFTGDPLFCRVWTLIGAPSLSVPLVWTENGLPAGVQLVAAPRADGALLDAAAWLVRQ